MQHGWTTREIIAYLLAYLGWLLLGAAGIYALFHLRDSLLVLWPLLGATRWSLRAYDQVAIILLILTWLAYMVFTEHHHRAAIHRAHDERLRRALFSSSQGESPTGGPRRASPEQPLRFLLPRLLLAAAYPLGLLALSYLARALLRLLLR